jgi:hypothetical protein
MQMMILQAVALMVISGAEAKPIAPPKEIEEQVKAFEEIVQESPAFTEQMKKAIKAGAAFYGKPYFIGGNGGASTIGRSAQHETLTFGLFNSYEKARYGAYSIRSLDAGAHTLVEMVMVAFENKNNWVAVYVLPGDRNHVLYITVYP